MKCYFVDAFTDTVFKGNPAAICVLNSWLPDKLMQKIAIEHNLSETAFTVPRSDGSFDLRWFTPGMEIDLCGHATLATASVLFQFVVPNNEQVVFHTRSGVLTVRKKGDRYEMDMPAFAYKQIPVTPEMEEILGCRPIDAFMGRDLVCVLENEQQVAEADPDQGRVLLLDGVLFHITAKGSKYDCVTRSFAPKHGVKEDPVCGSGHCHVVPYWAAKLGKQDIVGFQASKRSGVLYCQMNGERLMIAVKPLCMPDQRSFYLKRMRSFSACIFERFF